MQHPFRELIPTKYVILKPRCHIEIIEALLYTIELAIVPFLGNELTIKELPPVFSYSLIKPAFIGCLWLWQKESYYCERPKKLICPNAVILISNFRDLHCQILNGHIFMNGIKKFTEFDTVSTSSMPNKIQKAYCNIFRCEAYKYLAENDENLLHRKIWTSRTQCYHGAISNWNYGAKIWGIKIKDGCFLPADWAT